MASFVFYPVFTSLLFHVCNPIALVNCYQVIGSYVITCSDSESGLRNCSLCTCVHVDEKSVAYSKYILSYFGQSHVFYALTYIHLYVHD